MARKPAHGGHHPPSAHLEHRKMKRVVNHWVVSFVCIAILRPQWQLDCFSHPLPVCSFSLIHSPPQLYWSGCQEDLSSEQLAIPGSDLDLIFWWKKTKKTKTNKQQISKVNFKKKTILYFSQKSCSFLEHIANKIYTVTKYPVLVNTLKYGFDRYYNKYYLNKSVAVAS